MSINLYQGAVVILSVLAFGICLFNGFSILKNIKADFTEALFIVCIAAFLFIGGMKIYFAFSNDGIIVTRYTLGSCPPDLEGELDLNAECAQVLKTIMQFK